MGKRTVSREENSDLSPAGEKLAEATVRRDELQRKADRILGLLSASGEPRVGVSSLCVDDLICVQELTAVEAEVDELQREIQAAKLEERERRLADFRKRKAPVIKRLSRVLDEAVVVNAELMAIEEEEASVAGAVRLAWPDLLAADTPMAQSRPATWRRFVASEGFDL